MNESSNYKKKLNRIQWREKERRERIFNDKLRTIGVDKIALENQIREKSFNQQILHTTDDFFKKNLNSYNEQAIQHEQLIKHQAYKDMEHMRQIENMRLAQEQKLRNKHINEEALANIPTEIYHNYFNASSR